MSDTTLQTFEDAERVLAESLDGYESRPQQQTLARAVESSLAEGTHLIAQAGCGTGKSLGYAIPAILSGKRVVVTTATKALQDQIATKDLPFLAEHLGVDFNHAILKGRSNYLCQVKAADANGPAVEEVKVFIKGLQGTDESWDGERESLPFEMEDREWRDLTISSDECPGKKQCPFGDTCYAEKAKTKAKEADLVVVNHALFFTDLMVREMTGGLASMLDEYDTVIFDEAHEAEEWASSMLGTRFSEATITSLLAETRTFVTEHLNSDDPTRVALLDAATVVSSSMIDLWEVLEPGRLRSKNFLDHQDRWVALANAIGDYADAVSVLDLEHASNPDKATRQKRRLTVRAHNTSRRFADIIVSSFDALVRWVEEEPIKGRANRGGPPPTRKVIQATPIEVGGILKNMLWDNTPGILVSATMAVGGKFDYIANRLGLTDFEGIDVGTPFDYATQAGLYVPDDIPAPVKDQRAAWENLSVVRMGELVKASDGRALLLFTSRKQMENAYEMLADRLPYTCLMQGQAGKSNKALAAEFMDDKHSVLFALRSFFTGVDFQGEACSLVVIDKLPFPVPTEPVTEARCELIENRGGSSFKDYTIPIMTLILEQGFGRLIRHRNDRGVVAILDPRLVTKGYGTKIMDSLPAAKRMRKLSDVEEFYSDHKVDA